MTAVSFSPEGPLPDYDLAIIGSGFAGSLLALIARRLGRSVVLLERGTHPRAVIGESSTPLSNLLLEELADRYELATLRPLSKWGTWQQSHPELPCGLKRGFTFYHHPSDAAAAPSDTAIPRVRQLLVAASPHDRIADTHWYRAGFDHFLVRQAQSAGVDYVDQIRLTRCTEEADYLLLGGSRSGTPVTVRARFVVDATGPHGFLHHALALGELPLPGMPATQALYSHFSGVRQDGSNPLPGEPPPYPPDSAAVHHLFPGGWVWLLHFNNGITSAGVACTDACAAELRLAEGAPAWSRLLNRIPALREQFAAARPELPFTHLARLGFRSARIAGPRWALLPSAAGFVDPLLSTGFPLTLLGIQRLASIFESTAPGEETSPAAAALLRRYAVQTDAELLAAARLIAALYANLGNFPAFTALTMLYFAAASYSEAAHRLNRLELASSFLLHDHPTFGAALRDLTDEALTPSTPGQAEGFAETVARAIEPINVAGLADPRRRNWYPAEAKDLLASAHKLYATREEVEALLRRCGFAPESERSS